MYSKAQVETVPVHSTESWITAPSFLVKPPRNQVLIQDVAQLHEGTMPGEYDRYNMRRVVSLRADIQGTDLGRVAREIDVALQAVGEPPRGVSVDVRGQSVPMQEMFHGLLVGLGMTVVVVLLSLTAYFQSLRLALVVVSAVPAVIAGAAVALLGTATTLNVQSFMGMIMAVGVALANAILLVTFAERYRRAGASASEAALVGAVGRLRPILMTSFAMLAGMAPMALAMGEGGEQTAALGRAVIGGLIAAMVTTLLVLPAVFALVQGASGRGSPSLDPADPASVNHVPPEQETRSAITG
jgi:multidrug efflux pump subunit AcrB